MRLSEAIRLGSMIRPQAFDGWDTKGSCALAAAAEAAGIDRALLPFDGRHDLRYCEIAKRFPISYSDVPCPQCGNSEKQSSFPFQATIYHINDCHLWTRERIADFVETVEAQLEAKTSAEEGVIVNGR